MPDHVHMLVSIPQKYSVLQFMRYLKDKSSLMIFDKHAKMNYKFGNRYFQAEGYYVSTVGLNEATIAKYIRVQEALKQINITPPPMDFYKDMKDFLKIRLAWKEQEQKRKGFLHPLILDMLAKYGLCIRRNFFPKTFSFTNIHFMLSKILDTYF